jgi:hypothetical protein
MQRSLCLSICLSWEVDKRRVNVAVLAVRHPICACILDCMLPNVFVWIEGRMPLASMLWGRAECHRYPLCCQVAAPEAAGPGQTFVVSQDSAALETVALTSGYQRS